MVTTQSPLLFEIKDRQAENPLVKAISGVLTRVSSFKELARDYYFEVVLSPYRCPDCGGRLRMVGISECSCRCGKHLDPTTTFQQSPCCNAKLVRKTFHYACSRCGQIVPSRFLFDERIFDKVYFREMMREARTHERRRKEELKAILAGSRSDALVLLDEPVLETVPGLTAALNGFIGTQISFDFSVTSGFSMKGYRDHILSHLGPGSRLFSDIPYLIEDSRKDRIWRFVTLIFMQGHEVNMIQYGSDILVERVQNEAYG
jgi:hypothetical protein